MITTQSRAGFRGQTFVFFLVAFGTVFLLCGLGLDSSMLYLAQSRLSRACDAAVISGVQNFSRSRDEVSMIMRNVAIANFVDLGEVSTTAVTNTVINNSGGTNFIYSYLSDDNRTEVRNIIATGDRGQVTRASCTGRVPQNTFFMGYTGVAGLKTYNLDATAKAVRRPRLISLVLDRSGSMVTNGGAGALPEAVVTFLSLFDTNSDSIGIASYSTWARLELAHTNDFYLQGSNKMWKADGADGDGNPQTTSNTNGMKFQGYTAGAEGLRMAFESMRTNEGYFSEQYQKFIVFFTDGAFNSTRSFFASPAFTNILYVPTTNYYGFNPNYSSGLPFAQTNNWIVDDPNRTDIKFLETQGSGTSRKYYGKLNVWLMPGSVLYEYEDVNPTTLYKLTNAPIRMWPSLWTNTLIEIMLTNTDQGNAFVQVFPGYYIDGVNRGNNWSGINRYLENNSWPNKARTGQVNDVDNTTGGTNWGTSGSPYYHMARRLSNHYMGSSWNIFAAEDVDWNRDGKYGNDGESWANADFFGNHYPRGHFVYFVNEMRCYDGDHGSTNLTDLVPRAIGAGARLFHNKNGVMNGLTEWTRGAPSWLTEQFANVLTLDVDPIQGDHSVLRPMTYKGYPVIFPSTGGDASFNYGGNMQNYVTNIVQDYRQGYATGIADPIVLERVRRANATNLTGGWILATNIDFVPGAMSSANRPFTLYANSMAYSSRPYYIYDYVGDARWEAYTSSSAPSGNMGQGTLSNWQAQQIASMARDEDITVYTVNFSSGNGDILENIANDKDAATFNPNQPEGEYSYIPSSNPGKIKDVFEEIAKKIRAVLEQ